ncbi:MAG TPA: D-TA family PLP-dependent enzyme [Terriglobia bacterium]|nr:D-TA family PLP-dependent enzyme [Terriglobia bacterium]
MQIDELDTPAVVVDLDILEKNLNKLADYCNQYNLRLRPHTKTHKIPEIARMQIRSGAWGITVAKVGEAEVMAAAGLDNILIAYPILGQSKLDRVMKLARSHKITVSLDSSEALAGISRAAARAGCSLDVLVECDLGMHRCGLQTPDEVLNLAEQVTRLPGVRFAGILFYPGHVWALPADQPAAMTKVSAQLAEFLKRLAGQSLHCEVVSGGSTPTAYNSHLLAGLTEIRSGTYVFNDRNTLDIGACRLENCALKLLVTVISNAVPGKAMIDGGSKTFSGDRLLSGAKAGYGMVLEYPDIQFESMSEEHGHLDLTSSSHRPKVGERLSILPNHVCACVNMHDTLWFHRKGVVEGSWTVAGRGQVR